MKVSKCKCGETPILKKFSTFEYLYCPACKKEVIEPERVEVSRRAAYTGYQGGQSSTELTQEEIDRLWDEWTKGIQNAGKD